jgi:hypothetical protein
LDLAETKITDAGLEALLPLKSLAKICFLRTKITDKGIMTLTELPALREMQMHGTQVTKEGRQQFLKRKSNFRFN